MILTLNELLILKKKLQEAKSTLSEELNTHTMKSTNEDSQKILSPEDGKGFMEIFANFESLFGLLTLVSTLISTMNSRPFIPWDGDLISCVEAINRLKAMREIKEYALNRALSAKIQVDVVDPRRGSMVQGAKDYSYNRKTEPNFNKEEVKAISMSYDRKIAKLEAELVKANCNLEAELVDTDLLKQFVGE